MAAGLLLLASLAIGQSSALQSDPAGTVTVEFNTDKPKAVPAPKLADREKCYGISKAQENDGTAGCTDCSGTAEKDNMPDAWKHVPRGTCEASGGTPVPGKSLPD